MEQEISKLHKKDYFKEGEQIYIHRDGGDDTYLGVMHNHDFIELVYVISGEARHFLGDINYDVQKGDLVIVNYGENHAFVPKQESQEPFATYDLLFTPEFFEISEVGKCDFSSLASSYLFYSLFADHDSYNPSLNLIRSKSKNFMELFAKIYDEYTTRDNGFMNMLRAYLIELITNIFRIIDKKTLSDTTKEQRAVVNKAIDYMRHNFNTKLNLDSIVADMFLSKDYFRRLFKNTTGISITDFIQKTRIEEACKLLAATKRTVFDIAGDCGFRDIKFFYKIFKKITGYTPAEYRKFKQLH